MRKTKLSPPLVSHRSAELGAELPPSRSPEAPVRLNKYLSECGVASRRHADTLIREGAVMINGKKVFELGAKISPSSDRITVSGKPIKPTARKLYIMFHKPRNVVTTMDDPQGRPTISDFFDRLPVRVFPVGRLDWDTEGLILLTNDGDFAQKVTHPSQEIWKTYMVKVNGHPSDDALRRLQQGVSIVGGRVQARAVERVRRGADKYDWVKISISEGKNRQVRKMFEKIGFDVMKLQRVAIGRLRLGTLKRGEYVFLTTKGLEKIFQMEPSDAPVKAKAAAAAKPGAPRTAAKGRTPSPGGDFNHKGSARSKKRAVPKKAADLFGD